MDAHDGAVDHLNVRIPGVSNTVQVPDTGASPSDEPVVASGVRSVTLGKVAPRCPGSQHPEDAVEHTPVVNSWNASRLARQDWLDETPFGVRECVSHARGSFSEFESHDHLRTQPEMRHVRTLTESDVAAPYADAGYWIFTTR
jgi:hypothetical protein